MGCIPSVLHREISNPMPAARVFGRNACHLLRDGKPSTLKNEMLNQNSQTPDPRMAEINHPFYVQSYAFVIFYMNYHSASIR